MNTQDGNLYLPVRNFKFITIPTKNTNELVNSQPGWDRRSRSNSSCSGDSYDAITAETTYKRKIDTQNTYHIYKVLQTTHTEMHTQTSTRPKLYKRYNDATLKTCNNFQPLKKLTKQAIRTQLDLNTDETLKPKPKQNTTTTAVKPPPPDLPLYMKKQLNNNLNQTTSTNTTLKSQNKLAQHPKPKRTYVKLPIIGMPASPHKRTKKNKQTTKTTTTTTTQRKKNKTNNPSDSSLIDYDEPQSPVYEMKSKSYYI